jgi:hypothetical protein
MLRMLLEFLLRTSWLLGGLALLQLLDVRKPAPACRKRA